MRKSSWVGAGVFALGISFFTSVYFIGDRSDTENKELYDFTSNGLELNIVTNGQTFEKGDEIVVEATLTNELGAPVTYNTKCGEALTIEVRSITLDHTLITQTEKPACGEDEEIDRMIPNEQLSTASAFNLAIPLSEQETTLAPAGDYIVEITFSPTAQPAFESQIPITINQQNDKLVDPSEAKQQALESEKAKSWFSVYGDTEKYLISEELPYLENGEWVFKWHAMNADQALRDDDDELMLYEKAVKSE
ncbi:hypothetical protein [Jeotgalibacillus campisalis]|uniref:Uncharacterized protein n=1 Tax=Jeotgalibacillus campisalis TaxID=220754 RepID=A0A0C2VII9_9BACL|nr:hypothetical protein [Jeotgalibacillus campisalis]KIL48697.1 hypothetical protein KR50_12820 [Jeotgalibacillus campisalis]